MSKIDNEGIVTFVMSSKNLITEEITGNLGYYRDFVVKFEKELADEGVENPKTAPIILPDYSTEEVSARRWTEALMESE